MQRRPGLLASLFWNQFLWLIPITAGLMTPLFVLVFLGFWWFSATSWLYFLLCSTVLFFLFLLLIFVIRHSRLPKRSTSALEFRAKKEIESFVLEFDYRTIKSWDGTAILEAICELNRRVAFTYGIRSRRPELDVPVSFVLLAVERISSDMLEYLKNNAHFMMFHPLEWIKLKHLLRFLPTGSASKKEEKKQEPEVSAAESKKKMYVPQWVHRKIVERLFRLVGHYSTMLYSGSLRYAAENEDSWKYPLKISVLTDVSNPWNVRDWLQTELKDTENDAYNLVRKSNEIQTFQISYENWGEIFLSERTKPQKSDGGWFSRLRTQHIDLPSEILDGDIVLILVPKNILNSILILQDSIDFSNIIHSLEWTSFRTQLQRWFVSWRRLPKLERPFPVFSVKIPSETAERFQTFFAEMLNLSPEEFRVETHFAPSANSEPTDEKKSESSAKVPPLDALKTFCETLEEPLRMRKLAQEPASSGKGLSISRILPSFRSKKGFFRSRFLRPSWLAALYGSVALLCLALGGILYTQDAALRFLKQETAPPAMSSSSTASSTERVTAEETTLKPAESGTKNAFYRKFSSQIWGVLGTVFGIGCVFFWLKYHTKMTPMTVDPASQFWPKREKEQFNEIIHRIESQNISDFSTFSLILKNFQNVIEQVDRQYNGGEKAQYNITLAEILKAQQIVVRRLQQTLAEEFPGMDYLRVRDVLRGLKIYRWYTKIYNIYRRILWFDPISATVLEFRRMVNQKILTSFSRHFQCSFVIYLLEITGVYAMELYSGHLFYRKNSEPITIFLVGCGDSGGGCGWKRLQFLPGPAPQPLTWKIEEGMEVQSWWRSIWSNRSPYERYETIIRNSDAVLLVTTEESSDEYQKIEQAFSDEIQKRMEHTEQPPLFWKISRTASCEAIEAFLLENAEKIQFRQEFRYIRSYLETHKR